MPSIDFASRIARGGGGGDSGGGGSDNAPATVSVPSQDKNEALKVAEDLNKQYANQNVNYVRGYDANTGEVRVVNVGPQSEDRSEPAPVPTVPTTPVVPVEPEPTPVEPTPEPAPVAPPTYTGPDFTTPSPVVAPTDQTPDAIPTDVSQDVVTIDVPQPTYTSEQPPNRRREIIDAIDRREGMVIQRPTATQPSTGTFSVPTATAGLSAVPDQVTVRPQYTGTTMANLTSPSQGVQGVQQVPYMNNLGQTLTVTEVNGTPITYVPPGYIRATDQQAQMQAGNVSATQAAQATPTVGSGAATLGAALNMTPSLFGMAEGGSVQDTNLDNMYRMATKFLGYSGPKTRESLSAFRNSSPSISAKMRGYDSAMARGGLMTKGYQEGGVVAALSSPVATTLRPNMPGFVSADGVGDRPPSVVFPGTDSQGNLLGQASAPVTPLTTENLAQMQASAVQQTMQPRQATIQQLVPQAADFIAPTAGQTAPVAPMAEAATLGRVQLAQPVAPIAAAQVTPATAADAVQQMTAATQAAQGAVSPQAQVQAAQQMQSSVTGLEAAQGTAIMMTNPVQREIQAGELISGVADAEKAAVFTEQVQAAQATPSKQATVQGQLEGLMAQFEGGTTPAWAAGAMRTATATLAARGLGASSLAGQAVIQATMEAALPIAQIDAQTQASFEAQNLSNRQQRAMLAAQQRAEFLGLEFNQAFQARVANSSRIGDIANMNFTAEQQVALENSRAANTVNLQNLNNRQAKVMAEAAALSQLDMANLSNRQQSAVQNAQNFMQMDLTNLSNEQQTEMFKAQQNIQALFTDQAAENAAQQINAASENQTNQFFATLSSQTSQFNATQTNAIEQFNVNSVNALRRFNSEVQQQRDLFNAQNGLVIAQANAQWRQNLATINNAAINESNREFAQTMNSLTAKNMDAIWQRERDIMSYAVQTANNNADRATEILKQKLANDASLSIEDSKKTSALMEVGGAVARDIIGGIIGF
jgi:hypothetical protein